MTSTEGLLYFTILVSDWIIYWIFHWIITGLLLRVKITGFYWVFVRGYWILELSFLPPVLKF